MKEGEETNAGEESESVFAIVSDHEEESLDASGRKVRSKGVYLLPNLFTTAALFAGFYAIISGMKGNFEAAGIAIIVAQFMDGFDGRVARMTNTTSAFGVEYDSLSDMVSFGLAPALVIFSWGLEPLGKFGWAAAFLFAACAALRLARFNTQVSVVDKKVFVGLASPPSAAVLATLVWSWSEVVPSVQVSIMVACLTVILGILMVSNVPYPSFKELNLKGRVPFVVMFIGLLIFVIVTVDPARVLLVMACTYCLSGPVMWLNKQRLLRKQRVSDTADSSGEAVSKDTGSQVASAASVEGGEGSVEEGAEGLDGDQEEKPGFGQK